MMALEIAMDEMAEKLGMDPVEFRIAQRHAGRSRRSRSARSRSASLVECLRTGAERFGWSKRNAQPGQVRDGRWLVGMGVAAAFRDNLVTKSARARAARQPRHRHGRDRHDRHRHRQLHDHRADRRRDDGRAARQGGRAPGRLDLPGVVRLGRAVGRQQLDRRRLRRLHEAARGGRAEGSASTPATRCSPTARCASGDRSVPLAEAAGDDGPRRRGRASSTATSTRSTSSRPSARTSSRSASTPPPARSRVRRMLAVCAAGRILNPKTARSQVIGAMTMGVGAALMEELAVDKRLRLLRQPRPRRLRGAGARRHPAPGGDLPRRDRPDVVADEGQGRRRARHLRRRPPPWPTRSTTPPACACATIRSRSTSCWPGCHHSRADIVFPSGDTHDFELVCRSGLAA